MGAPPSEKLGNAAPLKAEVGRPSLPAPLAPALGQTEVGGDAQPMMKVVVSITEYQSPVVGSSSPGPRASRKRKAPRGGRSLALWVPVKRKWIAVDE